MKTIEISKLLSYVLRHKPDAIGLQLDEHGWANVEELLLKCKQDGKSFSVEQLCKVVAENDKQRFAFNEDKSRIRASQGHSIPVELDLSPAVPPAVLYHGTVEKFLDSILKHGLTKMQRHHLHLSAVLDTAKQVGSRRGAPLILKIDSLKMHQEGYIFYLSANSVWLTDTLPPQFISLFH